MERKVGEIIELHNKWYQCVEGKCCSACCLYDDCFGYLKLNYIGNCSALSRSDKKSVIFKKLEKVGEPFERNGYMYQEYKTHTYPLLMSGGAKIPTDNGFAVIIKQNKEDMEENKLNLKPFDIQKAREGKPVCTRDGRKARIICWDIEDRDNPIAAAVFMGECESVYLYTNKGEYNKGKEDELDLMMLSEKKEGWVNVYYDNDASSHRGCRYIYDTKERAVKEAGSNYITTVKINWEE